MAILRVLRFAGFGIFVILRFLADWRFLDFWFLRKMGKLGLELENSFWTSWIWFAVSVWKDEQARIPSKNGLKLFKMPLILPYFVAYWKCKKCWFLVKSWHTIIDLLWLQCRKTVAPIDTKFGALLQTSWKPIGADVRTLKKSMQNVCILYIDHSCGFYPWKRISSARGKIYQNHDI